MIIFISGGCKNGKTKLGLDLGIKLSRNCKRYYLATMIPFDTEDNVRVKRHQEERKNLGFISIEKGTDIGNIPLDNKGVIVLDALTSLLLNETFKAEKEGITYDIAKKICLDLDIIFNNYKDVIVISDFIYSDGVIYNEYTENFKKALACIDKYVANKANIVIERVLGINHYIKGNIEI